MYQEEQQFGSYRLHKHLEHGTIADAYLATHIPTDKSVIIKIFQPTLSEEHLTQGLAYIHTCTLLEHPAILHPHDFGQESGSLFLVIDVPGETLRQRHPQGLPVPLDTIASYVNQIANVLHFAHNQHMLHLNLRPEQLFVGPNNTILLDYTSRLLSSPLLTFIPTDALYTPQEPPTPATDQYALAMIIYEWLSGTLPFSDTINKQSILPMPSEHVSIIWSRVEQVLIRALSLDPLQRYEHVLAFADAFILALNVGPEAAKRLQKLLSSGSITTFGAGSLQIAAGGKWHNPFGSGFSFNTHYIHTLAFSPNNNYLAFNSSEPAIYVVEVTEQGTLFTYQGHIDTVSALTWSPDGQAIASMSATTIQIWEVATGKLLSTYQVPPSSRELQWSPDGKFLATAGWNSPIQLWQVFTDNTPLTYNGHSGSVSSIAWSPDSTRIASASKGEIHIWEVATGMLICTYRGHFGEINAVAWSPDGTMIVSGGNDMTLHIWNAATRASLFLHHFSSSIITAIGWSPDKDSIITGTRDGIIGAYAVKDGENVFSYHSHIMHNEHMSKVAWSPDLNILAVGGEDRRVEIANRTDGKILLCRAPAALIEKIGQATVSQDELMTTTSTHSISTERITTTTTTTTTIIPPSKSPVVHTTTRQRRAVKMWGGKDSRDIVTYYGHKSAVVPLAWSPDSSRLASGGYDGSMHVWDARSCATIFIYRGHLDPVVAVAWSPDGTRLASGSLDHTVKIWNLLTGQEILTYRGHQNFVQALVWSPDSTRIASGSDDSTVQVWDASSGKTILTYNEHTASINSVDWSSDGQRIASGSADQTVHVWEAATGNTVFVYRNHVAAVLAIAWSPDGTRIASCSAYKWRHYEESLHASAQEAKLHIWTVPTDQASIIYGQVEHPEMRPYDTISVAWSPDGQMLATCGMLDIQIYDTSTGEAMAVIMDHLRSKQPENVLHIAWSPDGTRIAGSISNGRVQIWPAHAQPG